MVKRRTSFQIVRSVIFALVVREMKGRFGRMRMGAFWTLAEPLFLILTFAVLYSAVRGSTVMGIPFPVFLLAGMPPFFLFRNLALKLMESVDANRALFSYKQIKPLDTFVARLVVEFSIYAIVYALLCFGFMLYGFDIGIAEPLEWMGIICLGVCFGFGLGVLLAIFVHALPELKIVVKLTFLPLYLISGVIFPPKHVPPEILQYLLWNPFLHLMELIRGNVFNNYQMVDGISARYVAEVAVVVLFAGIGLYRLRMRALMSLQG